ncbi:hypothetical protein J3R30DRAFT_2103134 [Lentinula aciculospora]|uniref:Ankyrin n=1 Tax=Lentinula aciculospora TaxID=153920 RepID=A0A9W9AGH7_9AGAR|nr:hypothetical protein J3R30DRAFT_2103134 [Lentinula aciculospora]
MENELKLQRLSSLELLPIELLYEIQLYALSQSLPCTSHSLHQIYESAPSSFKAEYICLRVYGCPENVFTKALRYPLCSLRVLLLVKRNAAQPEINRNGLELPKRFFRDLRAQKVGSTWTEQDHPLPFIHGLYTAGFSLDVNSNNGYALTKAVQIGFSALVQLLIEKGASPTYKDNLAVRVAIRQKDLRMVKLLVERGSGGGEAKRRKLEDRVMITKDLLKLAVKCNSQDIVNYFTLEKGCVPDMQTLYLMC